MLVAPVKLDEFGVQFTRHKLNHIRNRKVAVALKQGTNEGLDRRFDVLHRQSKRRRHHATTRLLGIGGAKGNSSWAVRLRSV